MSQLLILIALACLCGWIVYRHECQQRKHTTWLRDIERREQGTGIEQTCWTWPFRREEP